MSVQEQVDLKYTKLTDIEHVLSRPGMYIGEVLKSVESVFTMESESICRKNCEYSAGFLKLFDEILTNAIDYSLENELVTKIKVNIDREKSELSVWNNGGGIPIMKHSEHGIYIPELIFGHMRTGSNYDERKSRVGGGINGLGSKAVNIFSKRFEIETINDGKKYVQVWSENMSKRTEPKITKNKTPESTRVSWVPDYKRFGMKDLGELEDDTYNLIKKRVIDSIISTPKRVKIYFNEVLVKGNTLKDYVKYYFKESSVFYDTMTFKYNELDLMWEIGVVESEGYSQVSFVNGLCTTQGGTHVRYITDRVISKLKEVIEPKLTKKVSKDALKAGIIKERLFFFIRASIINPRFNSQTKELLTTPVKDFNCDYKISLQYAQKILKGTSIMTSIIEEAQYKDMQEMKRKTDGVKRSVVFVSKLEDATYAGTSKSNRCTLLLTEGDSGKTFAMRVRPNNEEYGVFPLKGKVLNVRSATMSQLLNNEEINNLKKIIGLEQGKEYKSTSGLRYNRIMLLTDADSDAAHIRALIVNIFDAWWPSLLKLPESFIITLRTPIVKAVSKSVREEFLTEHDYIEWKRSKSENELKTYKIHYYKGLGTSTKQDAQDIMKRIESLTLSYYYKDIRCHEAMLMAFDKGVNDKNVQYTDMRKEWLREYTLDTVDSRVKKLSIKDMINKELIHFSMYDNIRSIPNMMDGLKPSQRKIMHYILGMKDNSLIKVAQLSGYVSAETSYHHGEASLQQAIICLAQDFVGSNNMCLLSPEGNFGTRLKGGSDHASPRYIFTCLSDYTSELYDKRDVNVLKYVKEDGKKIEPEYFAPILPMILVNGGRGIGTGYSTTIPSFDVSTIMMNIKGLLEKENAEPKRLDIKEMYPWYNNFKGEILKDIKKEGCWNTMGVYKRESSTRIMISELPIGTWITDYMDFLKCLIDTYKPQSSKDVNPYIKHPLCGLLKSVEYMKPDESLDENRDIKIKVEFLNKDDMSRSDIVKDFRLSSMISVNNMYLYDDFHKLVKYNNAEEILISYYKKRIELYNKRKEHIIKVLREELDILRNKARFIKEYISEELLIVKVSEKDILKKLKEREYKIVDGGYDYMLSMSIKSLTLERMTSLSEQCETKERLLLYYKQTSCYKLWLTDLEKLEKKMNI